MQQHDSLCCTTVCAVRQFVHFYCLCCSTVCAVLLFVHYYCLCSTTVSSVLLFVHYYCLCSTTVSALQLLVHYNYLCSTTVCAALLVQEKGVKTEDEARSCFLYFVCTLIHSDLYKQNYPWIRYWMRYRETVERIWAVVFHYWCLLRLQPKIIWSYTWSNSTIVSGSCRWRPVSRRRVWWGFPGFLAGHPTIFTDSSLGLTE